ncbi:polyamine-transporting ATPase 13A3-like isoform X2 [Stigmatopora argus]
MKVRRMKILNRGLEDELEVWGYRWCAWKLILVAAGGVCSGGLLLLLLYWLPSWGVRATCAQSSLRRAQVLLLRTTDDFKTWFRTRVRLMSAPGTSPFEDGEARADGDRRQNGGARPAEEGVEVRYFSHHSLKYYWCERSQSFKSYRGLGDTEATCGELHTGHASGLSKRLRDYRALFFGHNEIDVKIPPIPKLLLKEVLNPFYIFQLFSFALWSLEGFYLYSLCMLSLTLLVIAATLYGIRRNYVKLRRMVVVHGAVQVSVCRGKEGVEQVASSELVPGDVLALPPGGCYVPCDAVLLCGSCTVDESMLTGESSPLTKSSVPSSGEAAKEAYGAEEHKRHTLFCGSRVLRNCGRGDRPVRALVVRTGFRTEKGQLVRSILYPRPTDFKLHRDAMRFMLCMGAAAAVGFAVAVVFDVRNQVPVAYLVFNSLNLLTVALCPILPLTLTVGLYEAQRRLKRMGIFCVSPQRINIAGQLDLVCFDKTGTLTEDNLDLWAIQRAQGGTFGPPDTEIGVESLADTAFLACMATCHSLVAVEGKLCGDALDLKAFAATGSVLEEPTEKEAEMYAGACAVVRRPEQSVEWGVVRQFPFSSALRRMSVVVRQLGREHADAYLKGAPETVARLCKASTEGLKGHRPGTPSAGVGSVRAESQPKEASELDPNPTTTITTSVRFVSTRSEQVESDADFLGLIILFNKIKERTADVLLDLRRANIRTLMATGDNLSTAVSVARECGMVGAREKVIVADAAPPDEEKPASVTWRYSENPVVGDRGVRRDVYPGPEVTAGAPSTRPVVQMAQVRFAVDGSPSADEPPGYHFAVSGPSYDVIARHFPELLPKLLLRATVFARMTPDQKTHLVQGLQNMDYIVGMCGDGANDCGALKKAHIGISLSELEASVASAFTSSVPDVSCVPTVIREGRAALVTSFCVFKFVALYSLLTFCSLIQLYAVFSNFGDYQFLSVDIGSGILLPCTICLNPTCRKLARRLPPTRLFCGPVLFSVVSQTINCLLFQMLAVHLAQRQPWYRTTDPHSCFESDSDDLFSFDVVESDDAYIRTFENTTLFYVVHFQCLAVAVALVKGRPFREPTYKNWSFMLSCAALAAGVLLVMLYPFRFFDEHMLISCIPYSWRLTLLVIMLVHAATAIILENVIVDVLWDLVASKVRAKRSRALDHKQSCCGVSKLSAGQKRPLKVKYKSLAVKLQEETDWPPAPSSVTFSAAPPHLHTSVGL